MLCSVPLSAVASVPLSVVRGGKFLDGSVVVGEVGALAEAVAVMCEVTAVSHIGIVVSELVCEV